MRIPDRKKQRREYLKKKTKAVSTWLAGSILMGIVLITFGTCICLVMTSVSPKYVREVGNLSNYIWAFFFALLAIGGAVACPKILNIINEARRFDAQIPYAPPVTSDTLPAEEVLVRGA